MCAGLFGELFSWDKIHLLSVSIPPLLIFSLPDKDLDSYFYVISFCVFCSLLLVPVLPSAPFFEGSLRIPLSRFAVHSTHLIYVNDNIVSDYPSSMILLSILLSCVIFAASLIHYILFHIPLSCYG